MGEDLAEIVPEQTEPCPVYCWEPGEEWVAFGFEKVDEQQEIPIQAIDVEVGNLHKYLLEIRIWV
ncbi:MAG TPA: hypothetical protein VMX56_05650 [Anaerolineales bacterium]|nr:hypothetical protein [Anaerolineales bacterium]